MFDWLRRLFWMTASQNETEHRIILSRLDDLSSLLVRLYQQGLQMATDIDILESTLTSLEAKVAETSATLTALATTVVDLRALIGNSQALEAAVTHAAARADKMLAALAAAEDAADDALPPTEPVNPL